MPSPSRWRDPDFRTPTIMFGGPGTPGPKLLCGLPGLFYPDFQDRTQVRLRYRNHPVHGEFADRRIFLSARAVL
jgi:hypothetical protein